MLDERNIVVIQQSVNLVTVNNISGTITVTEPNSPTTVVITQLNGIGVGIPAGGTDGQVLTKTSSSDYAVAWENVAASFLDLTDTPNSYSGQALKFPRINAGETGIEFVSGSGTGITTLNGLVDPIQSFAVGTSGTDFNISSSGTTHTFNIPDASNANRGFLTPGTQNLYGSKFWSLDIVDSAFTKQAARFDVSVSNTADSGGDFHAGTWSSIQSSGNFDTGQLSGAMNFSGTGTGAGDISSIIGTYSWAQSHSSFAGLLGSIYGNHIIARHIGGGVASPVIYGTYSRSINEVSPISNAYIHYGTVENDGGGSITTAWGYVVGDLANATNKIGFYADVDGSYNVFRDVYLNRQSSLKLFDSDGSNFIGIKSAATVPTSYTVTMPAATPADNTFLKHTTGGTYIWATSSGGVGAFTDLSDVPNSYTGEGGKLVAVNGAETGLEFVNGSLTMGTFDAETPVANGASIVANQLYMQSASQNIPGIINASTGGQEMMGGKEFIRDLVNPSTNLFGVDGTINVNNSANSGAAPFLVGTQGVIQKADNFNQTGIGAVFAGGYFVAAQNGNGNFTNALIYGSVSSVAHNGTGSVTRMYGAQNNAIMTAAGTGTHVFGTHSTASNTHVSGAVTNLTAYSADVFNNGTATNGYAYRLENGNMSASITNKYGVSIEDAGAKSIFAGGVYGSISASGNLILGSTNDATKGKVIVESGSTFEVSGGQNYDFTIANSSLQIQSQTAGTLSNVRLFAKDGDGTDYVANILYGVGTAASVTNSESLQYGWDAANSRYSIVTNATGTGTTRELRLYTGTDTNQFALETNGDVRIQSWVFFDDSLQNLELANLIFDASNNRIASLAGDLNLEGFSGEVAINNSSINQVKSLAGASSLGLIPFNIFSNDISASGNISLSTFIGASFSIDFDLANAGFNFTGSTGLPALIGIVGSANQAGDGNVDWLGGMAGSTANDGSGTVSRVTSVVGDVSNNGAGSIVDAEAFVTLIANTGAGSITNAYGFRIKTASLEGTSNWGISVEQTDARNYYAGNSGFGNTNPLNLVSIASGGTSKASLSIEAGSAPTTPAIGDIWHDSTEKGIVKYIDGIKQYETNVLFVQTNTLTVANTVTETAITSTGVGSLTLPANFLVQGKSLRIKAWGYHSSTANPNITIKIKFGSTIVSTSGAITSGNGSNDAFEIDGIITCYTTGATGTVWSQGRYQELHSAGSYEGLTNTSTVTVDTTASQTIAVTVEWGTASASNTITCTNLTVEVLK